MNWKTWAPAVVAVVLGGAAAKIAKDSMSRTHVATAVTSKSAQIVVVKGAVTPGQELTADQLALVPSGTAEPLPESLSNLKDATGRIAMVPLVPGQPVLRGFLAPQGAAAGLAALVPNGKRAVTIDVNETSGLSGMLLPGSHVDVVATMVGSASDKTVSKTIVQDVLVQAVGQKLTNIRLNPEDKKAAGPDAPFHSVTVIATPREAELIQLAATNARMTLVLRGANDTQHDEDPGVTLAALLGEKKEDEDKTIPVVIPEPVVVVRAPETQPAETPHAHASITRRAVTVIRNGVSSQVVFEIPNADSGKEIADTPTGPIEGSSALPNEDNEQ